MNIGIPGVRVGHWTDPVGLTGCTVVLCPSGTVGSGEVRGGAPGTRETDLLRPGSLVEEVHAVVLTGGSAFGLAACDGVMRYLEERGVGFHTGVARVPIVPAAVLFDLGLGDSQARPGADAGYRACECAGEDVPEGNVGAGTGATVAKLYGLERGLKGGFGMSVTREGEAVVAALAAVNAFGEVVDDDGRVIAGARGGAAAPTAEEGTGLWERRGAPGDASASDSPGPQQLDLLNTTLVVVATNGRLSKQRAHLLSLAAHDGIDRAIRPAHTAWDGDAAFSLATGTIDADQALLEQLAQSSVEQAIRRAVLHAEGVPGFPSAGPPPGVV